VQILPVLEMTTDERQLDVVQAFIHMNKYATYVEDAPVLMGSRLHMLEVEILILARVYIGEMIMVVVDGVCISKVHYLLKNAFEE